MSLVDSIVRVEKMIKSDESLKQKLLNTIELESTENILFLFTVCDISLFTPIHDDEIDSVTDRSFSNIYILHQILSKGDCSLLKMLIKKEKGFSKKITSFIKKNQINIGTLAIYSSNQEVFEICLHNIPNKKIKDIFITFFTNKKTNVVSDTHYNNLSLLIKYVIDNKIFTGEEINTIFRNNLNVDINILDILFTYLNDKEIILFNGLEKVIKKQKEKFLIDSYIAPSQYDMIIEKEEISILKTWLEHFFKKDFKQIYNDKTNSSLYDMINNNFTNTPLYNIALNNSLYFNVAKANINSNVNIIMKSNRI